MKRESIPTEDGQLAAYRVGNGPPLLMLHGGPGDTHDYLREVAEVLAPSFTCYLYDQRGNGGSPLHEKNASTLTLAKSFGDIERILEHYGLAQVNLFGHSWGASLALYFNIHRPDLIIRNALVSMGPLTEAHGEAIGERTLAAFNEQEKIEWKQLHADRRAALELGDTDQIQRADRTLMQLRVRLWVHAPELRAPYLESYFKEPPTDRLVNKLVWASAFPYFAWEKLARIKNPVWLAAGHDDVMPPAQAIAVASKLPNAHASVFKACGHIPWLEKPGEFYAELKNFLSKPDATGA